MSVAVPRRLPQFIAVGPPRTGTTWLDRILIGHVGTPWRVKETQFFAWNFDLGIDWYAAHFRNCPPDLPIGEIATVYFDTPAAPERIAQFIPNCKIICTLRDPVGRLYSHYRQLRREGFLGDIALAEAIQNHRQWDGPGNMFSVSRYAANVRMWRERFGTERVLVLLYDDLEATPQGYIDQVTAFLGIARIDLAASPYGSGKINEMNEAPKSYRLARRAREFREVLRRHRLYLLSEGFTPLWDFCFGRGGKFLPLEPAMEATLRDYFRPGIEDLEKLLGRDLSRWKARSGVVPNSPIPTRARSESTVE
jgi:Sulfotransferase domain